jgi:hypothetical protein
MAEATVSKPDLLITGATYGWSWDHGKTRLWRPSTETQTV